MSDAYSIALSKAALKKKSPWELTKVLYARERQVQAIHSILDSWKAVNDDTESTNRTKVFAHGLATVLKRVASFKDASFSGEEEWRLFRHSPDEETIKFRVTAGHIVPYTEIPLVEGDVQFVTQGPGTFRAFNRRAIHDLGHKCGLGHLDVFESSVSLG